VMKSACHDPRKESLLNCTCLWVSGGSRGVYEVCDISGDELRPLKFPHGWKVVAMDNGYRGRWDMGK